MNTESGGNQYVHKDSSERQDILNQCFRHSTAEGFRKSGIIAAAADSETTSPFRILEIGCGTGATTLDLSTILPTAEITAVDADSNLIAAANDRLQESESDLTKRVTFLHVNGEETGKKFINHFDAVWFRLVLVHVPDPVALLRSAVDSLKPGGTLFVEDCDMRSFVNDPPFLANAWLHTVHVDVSLRLGADVRRGSVIGSYLQESFANQLTNLQFDTFAPIFGKGVKVAPWAKTSETALGPVPSSEEHWESGWALFKGSLSSLTPKFLESGFCTQRDVDLAWKSVEQVEDEKLTPYQIFSLPGGNMFQWWATKI